MCPKINSTYLFIEFTLIEEALLIVALLGAEIFFSENKNRIASKKKELIN